MSETVRYPYSLNHTLFTLLLMVVFLLLCLINMIRVSDTFLWVLFGFCTGIFLSVGAMLVIRRLIPAIKGQAVLELTPGYLVNRLRNITVNWEDVESVSLIKARSSAVIRIELKGESDHGTLIDIPLRWVKGRDKEIMKTVLAYFDNGKAALTYKPYLLSHFTPKDA